MKQVILSILLAVFAFSLFAKDTNEFGYLSTSNYSDKISDTIKAGDISKKIIELQGKIVRAKTTSKYLLVQIAPSTYLVQLHFSGLEPILVIFPEAGFKFINSFPEATAYDTAKNYSVYLYVPDDALRQQIVEDVKKLRRPAWRFSDDDINNIVVAIGRSAKQGMRNSWVYSW